MRYIALSVGWKHIVYITLVFNPIFTGTIRDAISRWYVGMQQKSLHNCSQKCDTYYSSSRDVKYSMNIFNNIGMQQKSFHNRNQKSNTVYLTYSLVTLTNELSKQMIRKWQMRCPYSCMRNRYTNRLCFLRRPSIAAAAWSAFCCYSRKNLRCTMLHRCLS